jgi:hypothetical protein
MAATASAAIPEIAADAVAAGVGVIFEIAESAARPTIVRKIAGA